MSRRAPRAAGRGRRHRGRMRPASTSATDAAARRRDDPVRAHVLAVELADDGPSRSTTSRSDPSTTSSRSELMSTTARPSSASSLTSAWISALAPTSMPRVGSSRMSSFGADREHPRQQHLLLVAARQLRDLLVATRCLDPQARDELLGDGVLGLAGRTPSAPAGQDRQRDVVLHGQVGHDALGLAVLGDERDARRDGRTHGSAADRLPSDRDLPASSA